MTKALSVDLRERVVAAVDEGMSCRQAAIRFGVSASSAIRWNEQHRKWGNVAPKPQGGDRRSGRIDAHAELILSFIGETSDITLAEIKTLLARKGIAVGIGTLWRFFDRRRITLKKSRRTRPSRTVPIS